MNDAQQSQDSAQKLQTLSAGTTSAKALAFFDSLPPVQVDDLLGSWKGAEVPTRHPLDGLLSTMGWHGKQFDAPDAVHPLVFETPGGRLFRVNPRFVPLTVALRIGPLLRHPMVGTTLRPLLQLARTGRPRARIRMTEYRGVVSATMIYDNLPVNDVFRRVDENAVLGAMDLRGSRPPFMFALHRTA